MNNSISAMIGKVSPLSGAIAIALVVYGFILVKPMDYYPTPESAAEIFNQNPGQIYQGAKIGGFYAVIFLIWFISDIFKNLSQSTGTDSFIPAFALAGGILLAVGLMTANGILMIGAGRASRANGLSLESAVILYDLAQLFLSNVISLGLAMLIGATGLGALQTQLLPAWFGWVSLILAIGLLTPYHYIFEALGLIWVFAASVLLFWL